MELGQQALFFISALGVFNGFLLSFYFLFVAKPKNILYRYFGLLLLMLSLRIGKSVLYFFQPELPKIVLQIGLSACWLIGPLLFLYLLRIQYTPIKGARKDIWHLGILSLSIIVIGLLFPYSTRPELWNPLIVQGIYLLWAVYVVLAGFMLRKQFQKLFSNSSNPDHQDIWLLGIWGMNFLICLVFNLILYLGFPSYIFGPISFSFFFYALMAFIMFYPKSLELIGGYKQQSAKKKIGNERLLKIDHDLQLLMDQEHLYKNPSLKLDQLANELGISSHMLSQFLNEHKGKTFSDFVNEYRILASRNLLRTHRHLTMEGIGKEVGFRSKSAFYAAFKKHLGTTPSQYSKQLKIT